MLFTQWQIISNRQTNSRELLNLNCSFLLFYSTIDLFVRGIDANINFLPKSVVNFK